MVAIIARVGEDLTRARAEPIAAPVRPHPRHCPGVSLDQVVIVPLTSMEWKGSGPDSGPPTESFVVCFLRWASDPIMALCPLAGLVTAGLYWWLGTWWSRWSIASPE